MKKWLRTLVMSTVAVTTLAACGAAEESPAPAEGGATDTPAEETSDFKVGMVTDIGGIDDKSFNESAWAGLSEFGTEFALEEGTGYRYVQSGDIAEFEPNIRNLVREDLDLTWAIGYLMNDAVLTVSEQNADAQFAIVDSVVTNKEGTPLQNVAHITFKEHEGSFLVGVAAGLQTESNIVGFVGGVEGELIKKFENGFKAGVKAVNPDAEIRVQYAESFNAADVGTQIADTMYSQGADIIYHASGATGNGVFTEARNRALNGENVWVIGVDQDQHEEGIYDEETGASVTLTSMIKRVDRAVYLVTEQTMNGDFPGGEILEYGLEDEGVGIATTTENMSEEALSTVDEYIERILSGEINVPTTDEQYEEYLKAL